MITLTTQKIETMEQAIELANEIERLESVVTSMKERLKAYIDTLGPKGTHFVETTDKKWGYYSSTSWKFTPESLKSMAMDMVIEGINPWEVLSLDSTGRNKLGWEEDILAKYGKKSVRYSFTNRKK